MAGRKASAPLAGWRKSLPWETAKAVETLVLVLVLISRLECYGTSRSGHEAHGFSRKPNILTSLMTATAHPDSLPANQCISGRPNLTCHVLTG
jgi:hypothetical protein